MEYKKIYNLIVFENGTIYKEFMLDSVNFF